MLACGSVTHIGYEKAIIYKPFRRYSNATTSVIRVVVIFRIITRDTFMGSNSVTIPKAALPAEGIPLISNSVNFTAGDVITATSTIARARSNSNQALNYELVKGQAGLEPQIGLSAKLGSGDPLDITPASLITLFFVKLVD